MADVETLAQKGLDAYNSKDVRALAELYADDAELEFPGRGVIKGKAAIIAFWEGEFRSFPDAKGRLLAVAATGATALCEWNVEGTNTGPLNLPDGGTAPATGKHLNVNGTEVIEAEGGLLKKSRFYFDTMAFLVQLGLVRAPAIA
jgi:steroid delta-isomerase-like uncharacterized protein